MVKDGCLPYAGTPIGCVMAAELQFHVNNEYEEDTFLENKSCRGGNVRGGGGHECWGWGGGGGGLMEERADRALMMAILTVDDQWSTGERVPTESDQRLLASEIGSD